MRHKLPWFQIALSIVFLSATIYAACSDASNLPNRWFIRDDAYYYFKVAQNISEGHGSTFDGIHLTNGYHPLWLLICIPIFALARYDLILPLRVLVVVTGLLQLGTALLLYQLVRRALSEPVAMLAAAYWAFGDYVLVFLYKTGVESSIALFFMLLLLLLALQLERKWRSTSPGASQLAMLGVVAALVVFSRLDLIFFAALMGLWLILRDTPLRYLLPLDLLAILVSVLAAFLLRLGPAGYYDAATPAVWMIAFALCIKIPVFYMFRLYQRPADSGVRSLLVRAALAVGLSSAILSAVMLVGSALHIIAPFPRPSLLIDAGLTLAGVLVVRSAAYLLGSHDKAGPRREPLDELRASWRTWLREGSIYYGILGGSLALYMLWNKLAFGSFSPVSGAVKRWWGTFSASVYGGPARTWLAFFGLDTQGDFNAWNPLAGFLRDAFNSLVYHNNTSRLYNVLWQQRFMIAVVIAFVVLFSIFLLRRQESRRMLVNASVIPLFVGSWFQILSYNATGYASPKEWYWLTEQIVLILVTACLLQLIVEPLLKRWLVSRVLMWAAVGVLAVHAGAAYWRDAIALYPYGQEPKDAAYAEVVPFLESHTQPGAIIGMTGGGNVGYFLPDRTIVNMDGLINSVTYFEDLKAGISSQYLYETGMQFVFANPQLLNADPYRGQYVGRLQSLASWGGKDLMRLLPGPSQ